MIDVRRAARPVGRRPADRRQALDRRRRRQGLARPRAARRRVRRRGAAAVGTRPRPHRRHARQDGSDPRMARRPRRPTRCRDVLRSRRWRDRGRRRRARAGRPQALRAARRHRRRSSRSRSIASSIMSKKIAEGTDALVLDVKFGAGRVPPRSRRGAASWPRRWSTLGEANGVRTAALQTAMDTVLGRARRQRARSHRVGRDARGRGTGRPRRGHGRARARDARARRASTPTIPPTSSRPAAPCRCGARWSRRRAATPTRRSRPRREIETVRAHRERHAHAPRRARGRRTARGASARAGPARSIRCRRRPASCAGSSRATASPRATCSSSSTSTIPRRLPDALAALDGGVRDRRTNRPRPRPSSSPHRMRRGVPSRMARPTVDEIRSAPKVLLHDHLDGGLRPATIIELAEAEGYDALPTKDPGELSDVDDTRREPRRPRALPRDVRAHRRRHAVARVADPRRARVRRRSRRRRRRVRRGALRTRAAHREGPLARRSRRSGPRRVPAGERGHARSPSACCAPRCARPRCRCRSPSSRCAGATKACAASTSPARRPATRRRGTSTRSST